MRLETKPGEADPAVPERELAERRHLDEMLDEALSESFPASDAPAVDCPS